MSYDHEVKSSYSVVVKADDAVGGTAASVTVTITITDVDEAPERPAAPTVTATAGSTTCLSVSWTEPATSGPDIDDYDLRYRAGASGSWSNGPQNVTATLASIGSLDAGTSYQVQVRATNDEGDSNWSPSGSGATTAEATPTVSISADKTSAVFKQDGISYTLTRSGSTTGALTVSVTLTQTKDFLLATELTKMVTIAAGQSTKTFTVAASSFQHFAVGTTVEGGTLTAAVQDVLGYDLGTPSSVAVSIVIHSMIGLDQASYTVGEAAGTLTVKLTGRTSPGAPQPTSNTSTVELTPVDQTTSSGDFDASFIAYQFTPSHFSLTGGVWKAEESLAITITNDDLDEDDETFDLELEYRVGTQHTPLVDASGNSCGSKCTVTVTITDNDTAGVTVSKSSLTVTEQDTTGDSYTVVLDSQPTADVTISVGGQSGTDVTAAPTPMTFTTVNWATPVTVTGDDDADTTNDTVSLTHNAASIDGDYQGITIAGLTVSVEDDDTAAAVVEEEDSKGETAPDGQGSDDDGEQAAGDETGSPDDLKVVVSIKGGRATIGVQQPSSDLHIETFDDADLPGLTQEVSVVIERARAQWEEAPKHPAHERPAPPAKRRDRREQGAAQVGTTEGEAEQQQPETLRLF